MGFRTAGERFAGQGAPARTGICREDRRCENKPVLLSNGVIPLSRDGRYMS
jgi:hypothetical protein